jgi:hypothetical protein
MGNSSYSTTSRSIRSKSSGFFSKSREEIFTQSKEGKSHEQMNPKGIVYRECRDSEAHPNATPIQLYLDVTGSMGHIPHEMIKDGLPTLMGNLIQRGVEDASLMFGAIGDHECDRSPLQVGQFESGDEELDMWLTRTWLEGGGGGNGGESYSLAWYFAGNHVATDAWEKRNQKGFVFTIGDEPFLNSLPMSAVKEIMKDSAVGQSTWDATVLLEQAQKTNHVFHIFLEHGYRKVDSAWKELMGDHLIVAKDYKDIPQIISETILTIQGERNPSENATVYSSNTTDKKESVDIIL